MMSLAVSFLLAQALPAASLSDFLDSASKANIDQRLVLQQAERADAEFKQAWMSLFPSLTATATWTHNQFAATANFPNPQTGMSTQLVIVPQDQIDGILRFDVPLVNTSVWFRAIAADSSRKSAKDRAQATADLVRLQVAQSYFGYAAALAVQDAAKKSLGAAQSQRDVVQTRMETGVATELEFLRAKGEVARNEQTVADARALVRTTARSLSTLSAREVPEVVALPATDTHAEGSFDELVGGVDALPAVMAAQKDRDAANAQATASRLALVPLVSGQFTQRFTNATGFQNQVATYNFGLGLTWRLDVPTFQGWAIADANQASAGVSVERVTLQARDALFNALARLEAARSKLVSADAQVQTARRAAQVASDRYAAGAATQIDVISAERDLFAAEVGLISARTELASARVAVRIAAGQPVVSDAR
jgi:outer membrane protein TolC